MHFSLILNNNPTLLSIITKKNSLESCTIQFHVLIITYIPHYFVICIIHIYIIFKLFICIMFSRQFCRIFRRAIIQITSGQQSLKFLGFLQSSLTLFSPMFDLPENIRKPLALWCFQGNEKGTLKEKGSITHSSMLENNIIIKYLFFCIESTFPNRNMALKTLWYNRL